MSKRWKLSARESTYGRAVVSTGRKRTRIFGIGLLSQTFRDRGGQDVPDPSAEESRFAHRVVLWQAKDDKTHQTSLYWQAEAELGWEIITGHKRLDPVEAWSQRESKKEKVLHQSLAENKQKGIWSKKAKLRVASNRKSWISTGYWDEQWTRGGEKY